ncbi:MAG TPA: minor capsid protein [Sphingomicrobium sp.]|jgi:hypothetical protein|nr:minor capsid protein [Sphingomicrobium sp.]
MSFTDEIKSRLVAQGVTDLILVGMKPVLPDEAGKKFITMREYGGRAPWRVHNTGAATRYARPGLQVIAHAPNTVDSLALAYQAYNALCFVNTVISGTTYIQVNPLQEPYPLGLDTKGRVQFVFNVETLKTPS